MDYKKEVDELYEAGEYQKLIDRAQPGLCACVGPRNGDMYCPCTMWIRAVRNNYSILVLKKKLNGT